jgi:hypothetical protein
VQDDIASQVSSLIIKSALSFYSAIAQYVQSILKIIMVTIIVTAITIIMTSRYQNIQLTTGM